MRAFRISLLVLTLAAACGGGDPDTDKTASRAQTASLNNSPLAKCPALGEEACSGETVAEGAACQFAGDAAVNVSIFVSDFDSGRPLPLATVHAVDNESGLPTGVCGTTTSEGALTLRLPRNRPLGLAVSAADTKDTYEFNLTFAQNTSQNLVAVSKVAAQLIPALVGFSPSSTKGMAFGTVLNQYGRPTTEADVPIVVATAEGTRAHYFIPSEAGLLPIDHATQPVLHPANAKFVVFDLLPGRATLTLAYDGKPTEATHAAVAVFSDSVSITNLICTHCQE